MSSAVGDDEQLYRRVHERIGEQFCFKVIDGQTVFLHAAFNDPKKSPSVDRAELKYQGDPHLSRENVHDGIVALHAVGIRSLGPISKVVKEGGKKIEINYDVDVTADPKLGNCSHALVVMSPSTPGSGTFKRLKEGLVRLANEAGWTVEPNSELPKRDRQLFGDIRNCLNHRLKGRL